MTDEAYISVQRWCVEVLSSERYRQSVIERAAKGELPPEIEEQIWSVATNPEPRGPRVTLHDRGFRATVGPRGGMSLVTKKSETL